MNFVPDNQTTLADDVIESERDPDEKARAVRPSRRISVSLALLAICVAFLMTGFGLIIPIFPQRLQALGQGAGTLALMEAGFGLGAFLFSTPMGMLANSIGRKPVVFSSMAGFMLTNIALALVNEPLFFILIRFIEGALISGLMPAVMAMVGDSIPTEKQGRWVGILTSAQSAGTVLGPGLGGLLYQAWGGTRPFLLTAAMAFIASLVVMLVMPETTSKSSRGKASWSTIFALRRKQQPSNNVVSIRHVLWGLAPFLFIDFSIMCIYPFVLPQYPFYMVNALKYSSEQFGILYSSFGLSMAVFPLLLGHLSDLYSKKLLLIIGCLLYAVMNVALLFLHQFPLLIIASLVTGLGGAFLEPSLGPIYLSRTTEQNRAQILGVRGSVTSLGILLGPLMQAVLSPWLTSQSTFAIADALSLITIVTIIVCI
jgi:MFS family permease